MSMWHCQGKNWKDELGSGWWFKRENKWLYQNTTNGSKEKLRGETQWKELHNLLFYMSPTKKSYANEEWTQWNFIFLHYVFLFLAGLHVQFTHFLDGLMTEKKKPNPLTLTKFLLSTVKGKLSGYLPRHLRLTASINILFVSLFEGERHYK